jgi:hypothetical protein
MEKRVLKKNRDITHLFKNIVGASSVKKNKAKLPGTIYEFFCQAKRNFNFYASLVWYLKLSMGAYGVGVWNRAERFWSRWVD